DIVRTRIEWEMEQIGLHHSRAVAEVRMRRLDRRAEIGARGHATPRRHDGEEPSHAATAIENGLVPDIVRSETGLLDESLRRFTRTTIELRRAESVPLVT